MIVAIETSSAVLGVSLHNDTSSLDHIHLDEGKVHAEKLVIIVQELLLRNAVRPNQITAIAVSVGPGSFTGLRIGMSFAKGFAYAQHIPIIPVNTLSAYRFATRSIWQKFQKPIAVFRSHRDNIYLAELHASSADPVVLYMKEAELTTRFSDADCILTNDAAIAAYGAVANVNALDAQFIGDYVVNHPDLKYVTHYDEIQLIYGMEYRPVQWNPA